ncbi:MAG: hypothetical protein RL117_301 [Verrucomicrobiota bacterium]|jgi:hypothetical protein
MQRWILFGLVAGFLLVVGAGAGLWVMRQNRPDQQWVPLPLNPNSSPQDRENLVKTMELTLQDPEVLAKVVQDFSLQQQWDLSSQEAAQELLKSRMFVRIGEFRHPMTQEQLITLDIGVKGVSKEQRLLGEIATALAKQAVKSMGHDQQGNQSAPDSGLQ